MEIASPDSTLEPVKMPQTSSTTAPSQDLALESLFSVKDLVVVITGGGTGIGLMIAQALATNGAKVYIIGRREDVLQKTAETHSSSTSGQIIPIQGDVTSKVSIENVVKQIQESSGYINVLFNNAGVAGPKTDQVGELGEADKTKDNLYGSQDFDDWKTVLETNVSSVFFVTAAFIPLLSEGGKRTKGYSSTVINISSVSGLTKSGQTQFAYNTSKAAVIHLSRMMAKEFAPLKIRVNTIAPGVFPSEMTTEGSDEQNVSVKDNQVEIPAGRAGDVREMAGTAIYLASWAGLYTNGIVVPVDGGMLLSGPSAY